MLISLHVKNLALIQETEVNFAEGLNILSGETGAGKSIIIGSINLALGARADKDMIRNGAEYALVELVFQVTDQELLEQIHELEIPVEFEGETNYICPADGEGTLQDGEQENVVMRAEPIAWNIPKDGEYRIVVNMEKKTVTINSPDKPLEPVSYTHLTLPTKLEV